MKEHTKEKYLKFCQSEKMEASMEVQTYLSDVRTTKSIVIEHSNNARSTDDLFYILRS